MRAVLAVYLLALAMSHAWQFRMGAPAHPRWTGRAPGEQPMPFVEFPTIDTIGRKERSPPGRWPTTTRLAYHHWPHDRRAMNLRFGDAPAPPPQSTPILYLHGGPGRGENAETLAGFLNALGYDVYAPDLLGFGESTQQPPDCSFKANALACLRMLDALGVGSVHLVAHSQGGGVALELADAAPDRVATITLIGSIAAQQTEGSGSYRFEQARYEIGSFVVWAARNAVPRFGRIATPPRGFLRYFADSDQRPLGEIMRRTRARTLIIHGRYDFLVAPWAAEAHARMLPDSWLIMTPYSHFTPFVEDEAREAADWIDGLCRESFAVGKTFVVPPPSYPTWPRVLDLSPAREPFDAWLPLLFRAVRFNVALTLVAIAALAALRPRSTLAALSGAVACLTLDYGVAIVGMSAGCLISRALARPGSLARVGVLTHQHPIDAPVPAPIHRRALRAVASIPAVVLRVIALGVVGTIAFGVAALPFDFPLGAAGWLSVAWGLVFAASATWFTDHLFTRSGRGLLVAQFRRWTRYEFWPTWLLYLPLIPTWFIGALRARHPLAFTACNPGIPAGGGFIGESKAEIHARATALADLDPVRTPASPICPTFLIPGGIDADRRADTLDRLISDHPGVLSFPLVLKPDSAFRGFGFRVVRSIDDARGYFRTMRADAVAQPFHPGPHEVGILWTRRTDRARPDDSAGTIFSITLKQAPLVEGDGRRTLLSLILTHPRCALQARTFFARHRARLHVVPAPGERIPLAQAGNHCQGALFRDGAHLITPELTRAIDRVCRAYGAANASAEPADSDQLDFVRLDVRCRSLDDLARGLLDPWSVVELNGTAAESTNIYDPDRSLLWAIARLRDQWRTLYALGAHRMTRGCSPLSVPGLLASMVRFYRGRSGSPLSD